MKVFLIGGARPNFMKIAPIYRESLQYSKVECYIVHTGQHYDYDMSQTFFRDFELPEPHFYLDAGSGTHATQTAKIMTAFEEICLKERPGIVIVVGDVNSTLACSVVAKKELIKIAHVEAGLRSGDITMPEEVNRIVTDSISDYFFVTEESAIKNLLSEGKNGNKVHFVGNVMIDNLYNQLDKLKTVDVDQFPSAKLKSEKKHYVFLTLHRPANVDSKNKLMGIVTALNHIAKENPILFPIHPRTRKMLKKFKINLSENIYLLPPLGFQESLFLWKDAMVVMTDSGGLQEETTALGVPCITLRENTERPVTITMGTNLLAGTQMDNIVSAYRNSIEMDDRTYAVPPNWDGKASERIWKILLGELRTKPTIDKNVGHN